MNDVTELPKLLDGAHQSFTDAEIELALVEKMKQQMTSELGDLPTKLQECIVELDKLSLKTLRGQADVQLLNVNGAVAKVAKPAPVERRVEEIQEALRLIAAARARLPELNTLVAQGKTLLDGVEALRTQADTWDKDKQRHALRTELDGVRTLADTAIQQAEAGDIHAALKTFERAKELVLDGEIKRKMAGNEPPDPDDIGKVIARPDGDRQLDEMIKNLDESTQRKVVRVAFEKRFGCKLQMLHEDNFDPNDPDYDGATMARDAQGDGVWSTASENKKSPDLRRFYEVMSKLPAKHTRDNKKLQQFRYRDSDDADSSWAWSTYKEIVMNEGRAHKSGIYGCARPGEVPDDLKDEFKPANDDPITYFDWNTAHEVGHTLDAKLKFMTSRANQSQFGGWREYGSSSSEVAEALISHYQFDANYIRELLKGNTPVAPPAPTGVSQLDWNEKKTLVDAHYERMKAGNDPWASQATAVALAIGGRVYQQSYDQPSWSSYELSARQQAITGYQFRSPLEWFSELYAAFKSQKLKPAHPAMEWLRRLDEQ